MIAGRMFSRNAFHQPQQGDLFSPTLKQLRQSTVFEKSQKIVIVRAGRE